MNNFVRNGRVFLADGPATGGDPIVLGGFTGIAVKTVLTGTKVVCERKGVFTLSVTATGADIDAGDDIYIHSGTPNTLDNVAAAGTLFGYAAPETTTLTDGSTADMNVSLVAS